MCSLAQLGQNIINFLIELSIPIAVGLFVYAGVLYFTSGGSPQNTNKAKKIFSTALIGFVIALSAWLIVQTLMNTLISEQYAGKWSWNKLDCSQTRQNRVLDTTISQWLSLLPANNQTPAPTSGPTLLPLSPETINSNPIATWQCQEALMASAVPFSGNVSSPTSEICQGALSFLNNPTTNLSGYYVGCTVNGVYDSGGCACMDAVNTILHEKGYAPIGPSFVAVPEPTQLRAGVVSISSQQQATCGDLVIEGDDNHIGICANPGCSYVISNSSMNSSFTQCSGPRLDKPGLAPLGFYQVNY